VELFPDTRAATRRFARDEAMSLKVELKPFERIIIGESVITNSETRAHFLIDGEAPILREKDILTAETANSPVKRLYLCAQQMYLEKDIPKYQELYMGFVKDLLEAVPSFRPHIEAASKLILSGQLYNSLKEIRKLVRMEEELLR
jgi:flagellar biosynthesis repressor protein FlbT